MTQDTIEVSPFTVYVSLFSSIPLAISGLWEISLSPDNVQELCYSFELTAKFQIVKTWQQAKLPLIAISIGGLGLSITYETVLRSTTSISELTAHERTEIPPGDSERSWESDWACLALCLGIKVERDPKNFKEFKKQAEKNVKTILGGCPRTDSATAEKPFWSYFPLIFVK